MSKSEWNKESNTETLLEVDDSKSTKEPELGFKIRAKLTWIYISTLILPFIDEGTDIWSSIKHFM